MHNTFGTKEVKLDDALELFQNHLGDGGQLEVVIRHITYDLK